MIIAFYSALAKTNAITLATPAFLSTRVADSIVVPVQDDVTRNIAAELDFAHKLHDTTQLLGANSDKNEFISLNIVGYNIGVVKVML